ncbi:MAG: hypothetical protein ABL918_02635 [Chakrabartia sp.]
MWPLCTANNFLWLLLPLLLGLLTGWWAWANRRADADLAYTAPDVKPVIKAVEPVAVPVAKRETFVDAPTVSTGTVIGGGAVAAAAAALTAIGIPAAVGAADDLLQIKGVGPKLNTLLGTLGISRFDQIAAWGASEIAKVDDHLGNFKGRIVRDSWVEQAGLLATGAIAAFEAKFGKLDSENK